MRSWGRETVMAQLWALMMKAIRTDPGSRSADQAHVVAWLQTMMNRKAKEAAAQRRLGVPPVGGPGVQRRPAPPEAEILSDLQGFANGTLQPVGYMFGTAANSDSGYCDYLPPVGFEGQYDGNASKPFTNAGAVVLPALPVPGSPRL